MGASGVDRVDEAVYTLLWRGGTPLMRQVSKRSAAVAIAVSSLR